jgi:hypothetical protein
VDGIRAPAMETPDVIPPLDVESVLLFPGNVPPAYGGVHASCGVVAIRTRGGGAGPSKPEASSGYSVKHRDAVFRRKTAAKAAHPPTAPDR